MTRVAVLHGGISNEREVSLSTGKQVAAALRETGYDVSLIDVTDDLPALLNRLDLTYVTLVGHSMGGGEIARYLSSHGSQRISQIVLVSSTVPTLNIDPEAAAASLDRRSTPRPEPSGCRASRTPPQQAPPLGPAKPPPAHGCDR